MIFHQFDDLYIHSMVILHSDVYRGTLEHCLLRNIYYTATEHDEL